MFRRFRSTLGNRQLFPSPVMITQTQFLRFTATFDNSTTCKISSKQANDQKSDDEKINPNVIGKNVNSNNKNKKTLLSECIPPLNYKLFARDINNIFRMAFMLNGDENLPVLVPAGVRREKSGIPSKISQETQDLVQEIGKKLVIALFGDDLPYSSPEIKALRYSATFAAVVYDLCIVPADAAFKGVDISLSKILGESWNPGWEFDECFPNKITRQLAIAINDKMPPTTFNDRQKEICSSHFGFVQSVLEKTLLWFRNVEKADEAESADLDAGSPASSSTAVQTKTYKQLKLDIDVRDDFEFP